MLQKLHKTKESEDLAEAEKSFCQQLMSLHDYGYFFYTGRQSKKQDSEPVLFAVHATGVYFFEISKNVFKPAKQVQFYAWKNIKEIQYNSNKMQLVMSENAAARVKIYLAENKAKHIFDLAEAHHAAHLARLQRGEEGSRGAAVTKQETFRDFCRKVKRYTMESAAGEVQGYHLSLLTTAIRDRRQEGDQEAAVAAERGPGHQPQEVLLERGQGPAGAAAAGPRRRHGRGRGGAPLHRPQADTLHQHGGQPDTSHQPGPHGQHRQAVQVGIVDSG